jgi:disabled family protein 2
MRDLFQCVFELKKKEIELAKQHIQNRITAHEHQQIKSSILEQKKTTSLLSEARSKPEKSPEATANLVDLEQELSSIQRGITQMERITPNDDPPTKSVLDDDPFGDSFASSGFSSSSTPFNILPPPTSSSKRGVQSSSKNSADDDDLSSIIRKSATPPLLSQSQNQAQSNIDSWFNSNTSETTKFDDTFSSQKSFDDSNFSNNTTKSELIGAFTDLDPLGTKPYVDKKYFFHDLKNPPKKLLKDLSEPESIFDAHFSPQKSSRHVSNSSGLSIDSSSRTPGVGSEKVIDPFDEEDFSKINIDQLEPSSATPLTTKPPISPNQKSIILPDTKISTTSEKKSEESKFSYELPPPPSSSDNWNSSGEYKRQNSDSSSKNVFSVSKKLPKPNLFGQRNVKRDSNGINMRRLQVNKHLI